MGWQVPYRSADVTCHDTVERRRRDMSLIVNTSGLPGPEWVLSAPGIAGKIREIAEEFGVTVLDVVAGHSNLPTQFYVSTDEGVGIIQIRVTDAREVEEEIRKHFRGEENDPLDQNVIEETKPENLPPNDPDVTFTPANSLVTEVDKDDKSKGKGK